MRKSILLAALILTVIVSANAQQAAPSAGSINTSQDSDWQKLQALEAAVKAQDEAGQAKLQAARDARRANPLAWAKSLNPLPQGGWKLIFVASDGSEATFASSDQEVREGKYVTIWLRYEFGDEQAPQFGVEQYGDFLSSVEKDQFDCAGARIRLLSVLWFPENNLQGTSHASEQSSSNATWYSIYPGSVEEGIWKYVCGKQ